MQPHLLNWLISSNEKSEVQLASVFEKDQSEALLFQIDRVIQRVENNQLSAGQGWREVKRLMLTRKEHDRD